MTIETKPWDAGEFLSSDEDIHHYLEAAFEDGDPALIRHAFNTVARARGMTALARDSGISREALYKAFGENWQSDAGHAAQGYPGAGGQAGGGGLTNRLPLVQNDESS